MLANALVCATVPTTDLDRARDFFGKVLGLREGNPCDSAGTIYHAGGGTILHVYERPWLAAGHTVATFLVEDLQAAMAGLRSRGVVFEEYDLADLTTVNGVHHGEGGFEVAWVKDPDGNVLAIEQPAGGRVTAAG